MSGGGIRREDIKKWFLKPHFYALLENFNGSVKAMALKKKLEQEFPLK